MSKESGGCDDSWGSLKKTTVSGNGNMMDGKETVYIGFFFK